jgi:site-specific DNA recombinase
MPCLPKNTPRVGVLSRLSSEEPAASGERIRDKFAQSRARGIWMGGWAPLGYDVQDRKLIVNEAEAERVRSIFTRFLRIGSATELARALAREGVLGKRGKPIDKGVLYKLLNNRIYIGEAVHKGHSFPGEHQAIIDRSLWDKVHAIMAESPRKRGSKTRAQTPALLKGLIFGPNGQAMSPTHTRRGGRLLTTILPPAAQKSPMSASEQFDDREKGPRWAREAGLPRRKRLGLPLPLHRKRPEQTR